MAAQGRVLRRWGGGSNDFVNCAMRWARASGARAHCGNDAHRVERLEDQGNHKLKAVFEDESGNRCRQGGAATLAEVDRSADCGANAVLNERDERYHLHWELLTGGGDDKTRVSGTPRHTRSLCSTSSEHRLYVLACITVGIAKAELPAHPRAACWQQSTREVLAGIFPLQATPGVRAPGGAYWRFLKLADQRLRCRTRRSSCGGYSLEEASDTGPPVTHLQSPGIACSLCNRLRTQTTCATSAETSVGQNKV